MFWRGCNFVCVWDLVVNLWMWYFEFVNEGMELKVENVFCFLSFKDIIEVRLEYFSYMDEVDLRIMIIDNSFSDRSDVEGYGESWIIIIVERICVNKLIC